MESLILHNFNAPIKLLEVGTWFGQGSTKVWFESLHSGSEVVLIDSWRPYASKKDLEKQTNTYRGMDSLAHAGLISTLKGVYKEERKGNLKSLDLVRAKSGMFLENLTSSSFDFIYLDGSHYYNDVKKDILECKRIAKDDFSIICGDDLEREPCEFSVKIARERLDEDYIFHEEGSFHPGVLLAVYEEFGKVNMRDGFWWVFKRGGDWCLG